MITSETDRQHCWLSIEWTSEKGALLGNIGELAQRDELEASAVLENTKLEPMNCAKRYLQ